MELGNKIYQLRKEAKLSQEQLAEKLNVTRQTISNWELGQTAPDIFQAKEISKIFNISLDELANNDIKEILVEKITNTEKMANTTMKTIKLLCIIIICFLILIITVNITVIVKIRKENIERQLQEQEYRNSIKQKQFYITMDNEKYGYIIEYDKDNKITGWAFNTIKGDNNNSEIYCNDIMQIYKNCNDVRELVERLKQYFENKNGIWEETQDKYLH